MISVKDYLMDRDKADPPDHLQLRNMAELLSRLNYLFGLLKIDPKVSSGYRPPRINKTVGGAKMSTHTVCAGCDFQDSDGKIAQTLIKNIDLLKKLGLYLENPANTPGWVHLDIKERKNTIFNP